MQHLKLAETEPTHHTVCGAPVVMIATFDPPIGDMANEKYLGVLIYEGEAQIETWTESGRYDKLTGSTTPLDLAPLTLR